MMGSRLYLGVVWFLVFFVLLLAPLQADEAESVSSPSISDFYPIDKSAEAVAPEEIRDFSEDVVRVLQREHGLVLAPTEQERLLGSLTGIATFISSLWVWSKLGLELDHAFAVSTAQAVVAYAMNTRIRSFDRIFSLKWRDQSQKVSKTLEFIRRQGVNLSFLELFRLISGPIGGAHAVGTLTGQAEIVFNLLAVGSGAALVASIRNRLFFGKPRISKWTNFNLFIPLSVISLLDFAGVHLAKLYSFEHFGGPIHLNLSTLMILGSYASAGTILYQNPKWFRSLALRQEWITRGVLNKTKPLIQKTKTSCKSALQRLGFSRSGESSF